MDKVFFGMIRISSAIDNICEHVLPTLEKENYQTFKEECKRHFKERLYIDVKIYSPETRLKKELEFDDRANLIIPEDWENHYMTIENYNFELKSLHVDKIVPEILPPEEERLLGESDPYACSKLGAWLKHDTWKPYDGLLIILGIEPTGSDVNWDGYKNIMDIHIDSVKIINAEFFDDVYDEYLLPHDIDEEEAKKEWGFTEQTIECLALKNEKIRAYSNRLAEVKSLWDASNFKDERYSPKHYIEWAVSKNIDLPWLDWAIENKLTEQVINSDIEELGDNEKKNLLLTIGALTDMYANEKGAAFKSGDKPNISRVTEKLLKHLNSDIYGLGKSALNKRISDGIKLLQKAKKDS